MNMQLVLLGGQSHHIYDVHEDAKRQEYKRPKAIINITLTPPSNSWWINNTEFGEVKSMLRSSLGLCEEVC